MKLTFLGATHEVTGSCYYLEACGQRILIDCGMEQGKDIFENQPLPVNAADIDMVLLTHAHIDHSGKLPLLAKQGFQGQIFSTEGTQLLCNIMLQDSAHIQEFEAEWRNRKNERAGRPKVEPLYTVNDAAAALKCFVGLPYNEKRIIAEGMEIRFVDAGHLLGSASIEIWLRERAETVSTDAAEKAAASPSGTAEVSAAGTVYEPQSEYTYVEKKLVFSGDIGNTDQPLINDPTYLDEADYVVMESTYGNRSHERPTDYTSALAAVLQDTFDRGGNVVIPSFAVGRTQEMLYFIRKIKQDQMVKNHDGFEVWVDSPLAAEATGIFMRRMYSDFDEEATALVESGINPIGFEGLKVSVTSDDSKLINADPKSKVILSASGMCDAGRIRHHLKHNLHRADSTILFVGYQSEGTLGRQLMDGAEEVKLFGEDITVRAKVMQLPGISGHADDEGLMRWISSFCQGSAGGTDRSAGTDTVDAVDRAGSTDMTEKKSPAMVFVTHGEDTVTEIFRDRLINELGLNAYAPYSGTQFDLAKGSFIYEAEPVRLPEKTAPAQSQGAQTGSALYRHLLQAGNELLKLIKESSGLANADLRKFIADVEKLIERWK